MSTIGEVGHDIVARTSCLFNASILSVALQVLIEVIIRLIHKQVTDRSLSLRNDITLCAAYRILIIIIRQIDTAPSIAVYHDVLDGRVDHPGRPDAVVA